MFPYFECIASFIVIIAILEIYISYRQHVRYDLKQMPAALKGIDDVTFEKSQHYNKAKSTFGFVTALIALLMSLLSLFIMRPMWSYALGFTKNEKFASLLFLVFSSMLSTVVSTPLSYYSTFVIEEKFGFNKQTTGGFFADLFKGLAVQAVLGLPVIYVLLGVIEWGGDMLWLYCWAFLALVTAFFLTIFPTFIQPLFNSFEELPVGELRTSIEELATKIDFPLTKILVMDASKRSAHSNAYFYGFWKNKRIVLFDTLLDQVDERGILAILCHEFGHWKMSHTLSNLVIIQVYLLAFLYLFGFALGNKDMFSALGFVDTQPALIGLMIFDYLQKPVDKIISFLMHVLSRHFEYQADEYAVKMGFDDSLETALTAIHAENLSSFVPDSLYSAYHHSHPTLVERIEAMQLLKKK